MKTVILNNWRLSQSSVYYQRQNPSRTWSAHLFGVCPRPTEAFCICQKEGTAYLRNWSLQGARSLQNVASWCAEMDAVVTWFAKNKYKTGGRIHLWAFVLLFNWAVSFIVAAGKKKHGTSQEQKTLFYFEVSKESTFANSNSTPHEVWS